MSTTTDIRRNGQNKNVLQRITFKTSRELDFFAENALVTQMGHGKEEWHLCIVKELVDNSLDACEEHDIPPDITITADAGGITVADNGRGLPESTINGVLDFKVRASSRADYKSPTRGAQGNALKTALGIPFVLDSAHGKLVITTGGKEHSIACKIDPVSQTINLDVEKTLVCAKRGFVQLYKTGTAVRVEWSERHDESGEIVWPFNENRAIDGYRDQIMGLVRGYALFNPHLTLTFDWFGEKTKFKATEKAFKKWRPNQPTSPHWYGPQHLERLIAAYVFAGRESGIDRTISEFLREFDGLTRSSTRAKVMDEAGLKRMRLSELATEQGMRSDVIAKLLTAMKANTQPVSEKRLGQIGSEHLAKRLIAFGCDPDSIRYKARKRIDDGIAFVAESAFGYLGNDFENRQFYAGVNWSAAIRNPFVSFGSGEGLEAVLVDQWSGESEPICFVTHLAHPRVEYTDQGKSAIVVK